MTVKVYGMCDAHDIYEVSQLGIDWVGLDFQPKSECYVSQISSCAGIIPDCGTLSGLPSDGSSLQQQRPTLCGVFVDDMLQDIAIRIVNFNLGFIQLNGEESMVMIDNLRHTLDPDIHAGVQTTRRIVIAKRKDIEKYKEYAEGVDYSLFGIRDNLKDQSVLKVYDGKVPLFVSGDIGTEDIEKIKGFSRPKFYGISVSEKFGTTSAIKDVALLKGFLKEAKQVY